MLNVAREVLGYEGSPDAILVANKVDIEQIQEFAETERLFERLLLTSLHQLREERVLTNGNLPITGVSYSPDGKVLLAADQRRLSFWNVETGDRIDTIDSSYLTRLSSKFEGPLFGAQWSPARNWIAIASRDQTLLIAPCSRAHLKGYFVNCQGSNTDIVELVHDGADAGRAGTAKFSADGKWMATGGYGNAVTTWDLTASPITKTRRFDGGIQGPHAFAISPDMKVVAAGTGPGQVNMYDSNSGATLASLSTGHGLTGTIAAVAFNPDPNDSQMLAASAMDGGIYVWDDWSDPKKSGAPVKLRGAYGIPFQIGFSDDGSFLISTSDDGAVRMWNTEDVEKGQPRVMRGHKRSVWAVANSPDKKHIASGSADGSIILWDRYSAFHLEQRTAQAPPDPPQGARAERLADCIKGLVLDKDLGTPTACVRSPHGRVVVASSAGNVEEFDKDQEEIDRYRVAPDVVDLELEGDRLIVKGRSGSHSSPFFDDLSELMRFSIDHLPRDGGNRVQLSKEVQCRVGYREDECASEPNPSSDEAASIAEK
jgi:WD40 repeat protein